MYCKSSPKDVEAKLNTKEGFLMLSFSTLWLFVAGIAIFMVIPENGDDDRNPTEQESYTTSSSRFFCRK